MWFSALAGAALIATASAPAMPSADQIIAKYVQRVGGMDKIQAVNTLRRTGKLTQSNGGEAIVVSENKRPNKVRQDFTLQGMTAISAYDGTMGWRISPFGGKKEPEAMSEDDVKAMVEAGDLDDPLINYQEKGNKVVALGKDDVEGTETYKLLVTLKDGTEMTYYLDTDSGVPIKIETKRIIRGAPQETEEFLGDYKEVAGWYLPFAIESGAKGSSQHAKITYDKIEANVPIDDAHFVMPAGKAGNTAPAPATKSGSVTLRDKD